MIFRLRKLSGLYAYNRRFYNETMDHIIATVKVVIFIPNTGKNRMKLHICEDKTRVNWYIYSSTVQLTDDDASTTDAGGLLPKING
jgi:hypothetical protein